MRIGIDLGGTKIEGLVLDSIGAEKARLRVPTPGTSYEHTLKGVIDELALTIVAHHRVHGQVPPALRAFAHVFGPSFGG